MAERRTGKVVKKEVLSETLLRLRVEPEPSRQFPDYEAGQHIVLGRDDCKLTRKTGVAADGKPVREPEFDPWGRQTVGPVKQYYSIASSPAETTEHGWLEFLVALDHGLHGLPGRLYEELFESSELSECEVTYFDAIGGNFTLGARTGEAESVFMVGTGTGVAPFVSMLKELNAQGTATSGCRYTLLQASRSLSELAYFQLLSDIEAEGRFDFLYLPIISRPSRDEPVDKQVGQGRASNLVRFIYGLPTAEEEKATDAISDVTRAAAGLALDRLVHPILPSHVTTTTLTARLDPASTVLLACGNPASTADIKASAARRQLRIETEEKT
ncbi:MAG: hypothetical protein VX453_09265 [Acidobacteriota bacterium]|nr:hypothetical protein [Acidobacteriota bacterium]